jgi:hypothetical protein
VTVNRDDLPERIESADVDETKTTSNVAKHFNLLANGVVGNKT